MILNKMEVNGRVLITGANGFVGKQLLTRLQKESSQKKVRAALRVCECPSQDLDAVQVGDISDTTDWRAALADVEVIVHAAARAHIMKDETIDPLAEYRRVNVEGSLNLARQAAASGVKRFIFISSIKVNGEHTPDDKPFAADDTPRPEDHYGLSKLEAEYGLQKLTVETGMEVVIVRPPLVYGPGVKGNFATMSKLIEKGLPLPFGAVNNLRSLVALDNLVDLIIRCIDHPAAANQIFLVSDGHDLSTTGLMRGVAEAMGKPSRLVPVPERLLMVGATLLGKRAVAQRLLGSLQLDISKTRNVLEWEPPVSVEEGLKRCF
ncbi:MAG: SDR family oxidoreductase [Saccharospirillum sp.]|nr:SDR family oxidoreductase [Saccharospirillum sp.]